MTTLLARIFPLYRSSAPPPGGGPLDNAMQMTAELEARLDELTLLAETMCPPLLPPASPPPPAPERDDRHD